MITPSGFEDIGGYDSYTYSMIQSPEIQDCEDCGLPLSMKSNIPGYPFFGRKTACRVREPRLTSGLLRSRTITDYPYHVLSSYFA